MGAKNSPRMKLGNKEEKGRGYSGGASTSAKRVGEKKLSGPKLGKKGK